MKFILCTGDSHTQGEGAAGFYNRYPSESFSPYFPEGRGMGYTRPFDNCENYAKLVRDYVINHTKSTDKLLYSSFSENGKIFSKIEKEMRFNCENGDALILTFAAKEEAAEATVYADGKAVRKLVLVTDKPRFIDFSIFDFCIGCEGAKEITVCADKGDVYISFARLCGGEYAVINCGVGSCESKRYKEYYMDTFVREYSPWMFIAEAHTINDWLTGKSPEEYKKDLGALIDAMIENSEHTILLSVSPILKADQRERIWPTTTAEYAEYINAVSELAAEKGYSFVNANARMAKELEGLDFEARAKLMYHDNLHVNDYGHRIYAEEIIKAISDLL